MALLLLPLFVFLLLLANEYSREQQFRRQGWQLLAQSLDSLLATYYQAWQNELEVFIHHYGSHWMSATSLDAASLDILERALREHFPGAISTRLIDARDMPTMLLQDQQGFSVQETTRANWIELIEPLDERQLFYAELRFSSHFLSRLGDSLLPPDHVLRFRSNGQEERGGNEIFAASLRTGRELEMVVERREGAFFAAGRQNMTLLLGLPFLLLCALLWWAGFSYHRLLMLRSSSRQDIDPLTQLPTKGPLAQEIDRLYSTVSRSEQHVLLFFCLANLGLINRVCGRQVGNQLLRQFATVLRRFARKDEDQPFFLGSKYFVLLVRNSRIEQVDTIARQIFDFSRQIQAQKNHRFPPSIYGGLVPVPVKIMEADQLVENGHIACQLAGQEPHVFYPLYHYRARDSRLTQLKDAERMVSLINHAIRSDGFVLYAQRIVALGSDNAPPAYEILLRMQTDEGILLPGKFLPVAEEYYLANAIDRVVLQKFFRWFESNRVLAGKFRHFAINLSGHSLSDNKLLEYVLDLAEEYGVAMENLCFEITETAAISNLENAQHFARTIRHRGSSIALDDFGSGLSSFRYLQELSIDYIKIDGSFVRQILSDGKQLAMVSSINNIGHVLGMQTVAEFVENENMMQMVQEIGVDYAQGNGIAYPCDLHELTLTK